MLSEITLSPLTVIFITGSIIPIVTGLLTRLSVPSKIKGLLTLLLNAIAAGIVTATVADGTAVFSQASLKLWAAGFGISVAAYLGLLKPSGITSSTYTPVASDPTVKVVGKLANKGVS